jgi:hypothetical protein
MKWISVKELLPGVGKQVLTVDEENQILTGEYHQGNWIINKQDFTPRISITHWSELPPLPCKSH